MADIIEDRDYKPTIYEIATTDDVIGGPSGISNRQATQLAARTNFLKDHVVALEDGTTAAGVASKLKIARTISLAGDVTGSVSFDGSVNVSLTTSYKQSGILAGSYRLVTVDAKGVVTGGSNPTTLDGFGITDAAPLKSPALTDKPTAPTATVFDSSKLLANSEFVNLMSGSIRSIVTLTTSTNIAADGWNKGYFMGGAGGSIGLPKLSTGGVGGTIILANQSATEIYIGAVVGDVIFNVGAGSGAGSFILPIGDTAFLVSRGSDWVLMGGSVSAQFSSMFQSSLGSNGFQRLPNKFMFQFQLATMNASDGLTPMVQTFNFPKPFPTAALGAIASFAGWTASLNSNAFVACRPINNGQVTAQNNYSPSGLTAQILSWGY